MSDPGWSATLLDRMRQKGDPLADLTVRAIFQQGRIEAVNQLLADHVRNDGIPAPGTPPSLDQYLRKSRVLPAWRDPKLIKQGEQVFMRYGLASFIVLACASLPECYALRNVARILALSGQLKDNASRRILETAFLVLAVMSPGGLESGGTGVLASQKVRLMHAAMRRLIRFPLPDDLKGKPPERLGEVLLAFKWNREHGCPLSQEDLAAVLLTFSHVMLRSWRRLGVPVTEEEEKAYFHCWRVVGHIMGVRDELLPSTPSDARLLFEQIKERQKAATTDGRALTEALLRFCGEFWGERWPRLGFLVRPIARWSARLMMWELLTPETYRRLGVLTPSRIERWGFKTVLAFLRGIAWFEQALRLDVPPIGPIPTWIARRTVAGMVRRPRGGERPLFQLHEEVEKKWRVRPTASREQASALPNDRAPGSSAVRPAVEGP